MDTVSARVSLALLLASALVCAADEPLTQLVQKSQRVVVVDPLETLIPRVPRTSADADRIDATALFATARMLEQKGRRFEQDGQSDEANRYFGHALRKYQRAYRSDPKVYAILREIVPLAQAIGRIDEALRYALIAVEIDPSDEILLRWLAIYLSEQGELQRALNLYDRLLQQQGQAKRRANGDENRISDASTILLHVEMGRLEYLVKNFAKASEIFSAVQTELMRREELSPVDETNRDEITQALLDNARLTYQLFGEAHLAADRLERAEEAFRQAHEAGMKPGRLEYHQARIAKKRNRDALALKKLDAYFNDGINDEGKAPYQLLVEVLHDLNQQDAVVDRLEGLLRSDPRNVALSYVLAEQHVRQENWEQAEAVYQRVVKQYSKNLAKPFPAEAVRGLVDIYGKRSDSAALFDLLAMTVDKLDSLEILLDQLQRLGEEGPTLEQIVKAAEARVGDPARNNSADALTIARLALTAGKFDISEKYHQLAIQQQPKQAPALVLRWGIDLITAERYAEAAKVFRRGIDEQLRLDGSQTKEAYQAGLYFYRAGALEMIGRTEEALAAARKAVQFQPQNAFIAERVPWILRHAGRLDDSIRSYQQLIEKFDDRYHDSETREVMREARVDLSNLYVQKIDFERAEELLEQVLDEFPGNVGALNDLGYLWVDQGKKLKRALSMIRTAVAAQPTNSAYRDSLGWAYFHLKRYHDAVRELEKAADSKAADGVILDHLGDAYHKLSRYADAQKTWQSAADTLEENNQADAAAVIREKINMSDASEE